MAANPTSSSASSSSADAAAAFASKNLNPTYPTFGEAQTMASFPMATHDVFALDDLLTPEERATRYRVRAFMESEVAPIIAEHWEKASFPFEIVPKLGALGVGGGVVKDPATGEGLSLLGAAMVVVEAARVDASCGTFLLVHSSLAMLTIDLLGSDEQKREWLPRMGRLQAVGAWALTEPTNGSDAAALQTTATKVAGGWKLNGRKRWIGNATWSDIVIVWARSSETGQVNAFIVKKGTPGFKTTKIENKIALRVVQNADIEMTDVFVPDADRLPGVSSFADTNKVLAVSRVMVAWQPVGVAAGVYDMCVRYLKQREQFGTPLAAFQASQEKLARMQGNVQAMALLAWRLSKLAEEGRMTHEHASMAKAWNSLRGREVCALGRELLGGNGILSDFLVAKAFGDMEAIYTYEGTYEVNVLVTGRGATGHASFRAPAQRKK